MSCGNGMEHACPWWTSLGGAGDLIRVTGSAAEQREWVRSGSRARDDGASRQGCLSEQSREGIEGKRFPGEEHSSAWKRCQCLVEQVPARPLQVGPLPVTRHAVGHQLEHLGGAAHRPRGTGAVLTDQNVLIA